MILSCFLFLEKCVFIFFYSQNSKIRYFYTNVLANAAYTVEFRTPTGVAVFPTVIQLFLGDDGPVLADGTNTYPNCGGYIDLVFPSAPGAGTFVSSVYFYTFVILSVLYFSITYRRRSISLSFFLSLCPSLSISLSLYTHNHNSFIASL